VRPQLRVDLQALLAKPFVDLGARIDRRANERTHRRDQDRAYRREQNR
jgi:hypothetical protein